MKSTDLNSVHTTLYEGHDHGIVMNEAQETVETLYVPAAIILSSTEE